MREPLVTIYIPTYNRLPLLHRAVDSVISQTYKNLELIVIDDCSSDQTSSYLADISNEHNWIRHFRNDTNQGACRSRNRAISEASGEFITGLDDDDYFLPGRISDFVGYWPKKRPETIALTSARARIMPENKVVDIHGKPFIAIEDVYLRNLVGSQVFMKLETALQLGGFDPALAAWQDYELILRLLELGPVENTLMKTYMVDASHPHERITTSNYEKIERSCDYLIEKHGLTGKNALRVRSQLLVYRFRYPVAIWFFLQFLLHGDFDGLKALAMRFYRAKLLGRQ